jgi:peptidoglycan/LPS O-acetylase OafA/YrhL
MHGKLDQPMAKRYYRPELDALRFFAFACVFCDHLPSTTPWVEHIESLGAFGMCIFFVLSSYLIVTILLSERETTGTVRWKNFAVRRILRIWPLYFLVLFGSYWLGHYWPSNHISGHAVFAFSILLGNLYILQHGWIAGVANPLWSLSVEEQFYVAVPAITRFGGRRSLTIICIATIALAYLVLLWLGHRGTTPDPTVWVNSFVQFQFFAAGGLIALRSYDRRVALPLLTRCVMAASGLALWKTAADVFGMFSLTPVTPRQLVCGYLIALLGTTLIFVSVLDLQLRIPQLEAYLGKISYGLYLFHDLFISLIFDTPPLWPRMLYLQHHKLIGIPVAFGLTVATAAVSYHFFERPILKFKERFETIRTRPA